MRAISLLVPSGEAELASDRLWAAGAQAVEELPAAFGHVTLRTTLGSDDDVARSRLGELPDHWSVAFDDVNETSADTWRAYAEPIRVRDRLLIHPAWMPVAHEDGVLAIAIEPAGSFGLGDHPTTQLSARLVDSLLEPGHRLLDVGCGSGVLAILGALRGAAVVTAIDVSETAREATEANATANGCADIVSVSTTPVGDIGGEFDVVVANILAPSLVAMADDLRRLTAPAGHLVISGVLRNSYDHVIAALAPMRVVDEQHLDGWSAVALQSAQPS